MSSFFKGDLRGFARILAGRIFRMAPEAALRGMAGILALFALFGFNPQALAATGSWTGATDATWAGANWSASPVPGAGDTATFNGAGNGNTTIDLGVGGVTVGNILFNSSSAAAYTIGAGLVGSQTLTLSDTGSIIMNSTVASNELLDANLILGTDATANTYSLTNNSTTNSLTLAGNVSGGPTGGTAGTETLFASGAGNIVIGGSLLNGGASQTLALTKTGSGTLKFNGSTNAALIGSGAGGGAYGAATVNAGTLSLDFSNFSASGNANLLNSFTPLVLGGGTLQIIGNTTNASTQSFANAGTGLTSNPGYNVVMDGNSSNTTTIPTLTLGSITQNVGSQTVFYGPAYYTGASVSGSTSYGANVAATGSITTTTVGNQNKLLWPTTRTAVSTVGLYNWASVNTAAGTNNILSGDQVSGFYTQVAAGGLVPNNDANYDLLGNATFNNSKPAYVDTLRFNTPGTFTATTGVGGSGYLLLIGGILVTPNVGTNNTTIASGGEWIAGANTSAGNCALDVYQNNTAGELLINAPIYYWTSTARATSYVQGGLGTVDLGGSGANSGNTGAPYLNGGYTVISNNTQIGASATKATLNLNGGTLVAKANIALDNGGSSSARPVALLGNGGGLAAFNGNTLTVDGVIGGAAGTGSLVIGIPASSANGNVAGLLPGTGSIANGQAMNTANTTAMFGTGIVALTGDNTYTGGTTILGGATLSINGINALGGSSYGGLTLNNGTLKYATAFTGNGSGDLTSIGTAGVTLASGGGTIDTNGNAVTYAGSIGNGGSGGLTVVSTAGGGSLTLNGVNTYTGDTAIGGGTLILGTGAALQSSSLNYNNQGGALSFGALTAATLGGLKGAQSLALTNTAPAAVALTVGGNNQSTNYTGALSGGGSLIKTGTGTLTLGAAAGSSYSGGTTISAGTLNVTNTSNSATGSGGVALNGGSLTGGGTIADTVTQAAGTTIAPGSAGMTLTLGGLTFNGGTLSFALNGGTGIGTQTTSLISVTNATFTATPTLSLSSVLNAGRITNGETFTLFTSANAITGTSFLGSLGSLGTFGRITLGASLSGNSIIATAVGSAGNLVWAGGASGVTTGAISGDGSTWNNTQTPSVSGNWNNGGTYDYFYDNDNVTFNDTGSPTHTVNLTTANSPGSVTVNTASSYTFTGSGSGAIAGPASLTVAGGTLNLNLANSYTAGTNINAGATLKAGIAAALPSTGAVAVAGTLDLNGFNQSIATLSDASVSTGVVQNGTGNNTLTVSNGGAFSGTLINSASPSTNTLALTLTGGTLALSGANTYTGATTVSGGTLSLAGSGSLTGSNITTSGTAVVTEASGASIAGTGTTFTQGSSGTSVLAGNNTFTGATSVSGGTLSLTGSLTGSNVSTSGTGVVTEASGASIGGSGTTFTQGSSGTSTLAGANTYTGATSINGGTLQISASNNLGDGSASNTISFNGGKLESTANSYDLGVNRAITLAGAGTIQSDSGTLTVSGAISGSGGLTKTGAGALTLSGGDSQTGAITVSGGVLNLTSGTVTGPSSLTVGNGAILNIAGASVTLPGATGSPALNFAVGNSNPQVFISSGSLTYGINAAGDQNQAMQAGTFTQTGGTVSTDESDIAGVAGETYTFYLGGGSYNSGVGEYANFTLGTRGIANAYVDGGTLTVSGGATNPAAGYLNQLLVGAQYSGGTAGTREFVQQNGTVTTNGLSLGGFVASAVNSPGVYYLNGGTLNTNALNRGNDASAAEGTGTLYFGGGTLASNSAAFTTDANVVTAINSGGANFDTTNGNITFAGAIAAGTTGNVTGFSGLSGGSGYTADPTVTIAGGGGTGATAVAIINASGAVTDIIITNPGSGYTSAPTFSVAAPTAGTAATVASSTIATGTGGLTVSGANALILEGVNTYTGSTTINPGGTLQLGNGTTGHDGTIATSSGITDNGTLAYDRFGAQSSALAISGSGNVIVEGSGSQTLSASSGYTGSTTVTGTLIVSGSLTATSSVAVNGGTVDLNAPNALNSSARLTLAAGTLAILAGETESLSDLTLGAGSSALSLGATGSVIDFADSSSDPWTGTLAITNWNGNGADLSGGGSDQVIFANDDLSASQLAAVSFVNPTIDGVPYTGSYAATQLPSGEIVAAAVPEPGTWGMMIAGAGMLLVWQRSRRHTRVRPRGATTHHI